MTDTHHLHLRLNSQHTPTLTVTGTTATELAQAVHQHARGWLGARTVDIHLDQETLTGTVLRAGAEAMVPPTRVMEGVTIAVVRAPGGVPVGLAGP